MNYYLPENPSPCSSEVSLAYLTSNTILIINHAGNYVAGFILRDLRMRSKAHRKAHGTHELKGMLDLPTELILEVKFEARFHQSSQYQSNLNSSNRFFNTFISSISITGFVFQKVLESFSWVVIPCRFGDRHFW